MTLLTFDDATSRILVARPHVPAAVKVQSPAMVLSPMLIEGIWNLGFHTDRIEPAWTKRDIVVPFQSIAVYHLVATGPL